MTFVSGTDGPVSVEQLRIWITCASDVLNEVEAHLADIVRPEELSPLIDELDEIRKHAVRTRQATIRRYFVLAKEAS